MRIVCTEGEKKRLIDILSAEDTRCPFEKYICIEDDCRKCLEENIKWIVRPERK